MKFNKMILSGLLLSTALTATSHAAGRYIDIEDMRFGDKISLKSTRTGAWLEVSSSGKLTASAKKAGKSTRFKFTALSSGFDGRLSFGKWGKLEIYNNGKVLTSYNPGGDDASFVSGGNGYEIVTFSEQNGDEQRIKFQNGGQHLAVTSTRENSSVELRSNVTYQTGFLVWKH